MRSVCKGKPSPPLVCTVDWPSSMTSTVNESNPWLTGTVAVKFHHSKDGAWGCHAVVVSVNLTAATGEMAGTPGVRGVWRMRTWRESVGGLSSIRI